jgi:hypothetical protein
MVRGSLEYALSASELDQLFEKHARSQYTRNLLFSTTTDLLAQVVCGVRKSLHAAFQTCDEPPPVSVASLYNKVNGVEPHVAAELVRHSARRLGDALRTTGGALLPDWVPGYHARVLDGNHLAATEHRLEETRHVSAGPLPGLVLAVLDPCLMMVTDAFPCEDAHAQERALLGEVLARAGERDLYVADRNFCVKGFLLGLGRAGAAFAVREHANFPWVPAGKVRPRGRAENGRVSEQRVAVVDDEGKKVYFRRVVLELDEPTRDGETRLVVLTNLPRVDADARAVAGLYRKRWTIEGAFQELAESLNAEVVSLCHPRAALFAFCVGLVAYNALGVVKGAIRATHGAEKAAEVSAYYLADEVGGTHRGMMIALPPEEWAVFRTMGEREFAVVIRELAAKVRLAAFRRHRRGPKKPPVKRRHDPKKPHVSTARLLEARKQKREQS